MEPSGPAALSEQLYIGDALLFVNDIDLRNASHKEAVSILQQQTGNCVMRVQYIAVDDSDNSLEEDGLSFRFVYLTKLKTILTCMKAKKLISDFLMMK